MQENSDEIRALKADALRLAIEELRQRASNGTDPAFNLAAADLLEKRRARIQAGDDDHSSVAFDVEDDAP